jgi:hypothetical protein
MALVPVAEGNQSLGPAEDAVGQGETQICRSCPARESNRLSRSSREQPNAVYHFGILNSTMHMAWMRSTAGRLKSDISYAPTVYNNFPWPEPNSKQQKAIAAAAQGILDARALFKGSTLADLYDTVGMPPELKKAHDLLDKAVDAAYGRRKFKSDAERTAYLFELYVANVAPLAAKLKVGATSPSRKPRKKLQAIKQQVS